MVLTLALVLVGVTVEGVDAGPGAGLPKFSAKGGGENCSSEDAADVITNQKRGPRTSIALATIANGYLALSTS